jgi:nitroreductase
VNPSHPAAPIPATLRSRLRAFGQRVPFVWRGYQAVKRQARRLGTTLYYLSDMRLVWRHMHWPPGESRYGPLSAELLFQYHKLEKGLVMPGRPRLFGTDPSRATMRLATSWERAGHPLDDPIYLGALVTLDAYRRRLVDLALDAQAPSFAELAAFVEARRADIDTAAPALTTPTPLLPAEAGQPATAREAFEQLALARRSVRDFDERPVPLEHVEAAIRVAALGPTACNRQPNRVTLLRTPERMAAALALQNGNRGFGHKIPLLAILSVDQSGFFDGSERHQPYIDGGLFAMGLILALRSHDLSTCCLNWCVKPAIDRELHELIGLPDSERVVMLLAIGYAPEHTQVPRSPRRASAKVLRLA